MNFNGFKKLMVELFYDFCDKIKREHWATIDSIYISDQNLTIILFHAKRALRKIETRHSLYLKTSY